MATYKEIKGVTVQTRDEDPVIGGVAGASWSSGGALNAVKQNLAGLGSQTAALAVGGFIPSPPGGTANVEQYNGSSWTEIADLSTARGGGPMGAGTSALSIAAGGNNPGGDINSTEEFTGETTAANVKTITTS